jgi:hypothetical protein
LDATKKASPNDLFVARSSTLRALKNCKKPNEPSFPSEIQVTLIGLCSAIDTWNCDLREDWPQQGAIQILARAGA